MSERLIQSMEDIFEVTKQVYNIPNTPLLKEGMDTVAYSLDTIRDEYMELINYFCSELEKIKELEIEKATGRKDPTETSLEIIRRINVILGQSDEE